MAPKVGVNVEHIYFNNCRHDYRKYSQTNGTEIANMTPYGQAHNLHYLVTLMPN